MMNWVLIILAYGSNSATSQQVFFGTEKLCLSAQEKVKTSFYRTEAYCVQVKK